MSICTNGPRRCPSQESQWGRANAGRAAPAPMFDGPSIFSFDSLSSVFYYLSGTSGGAQKYVHCLLIPRDTGRGARKEKSR